MSYTDRKEFSLAFSVIQGIAAMGWAFIALDNVVYMSRVVLARREGQRREFGLARGTESIKGKLFWMFARTLQVAARMG